MIQMISGVYGTKMKGPDDGPFALSAAEEERLVKRGVAKYVGVPVKEPGLEDMTMAQLRMLAKELGVTIKVGMTKAAAIEALVAAHEEQIKDPDGDPDPETEDDGTDDPEDEPDGDHEGDDGTDDPEDEPDGDHEGDDGEQPPEFDPAEAVQ